MVVRNLLSLEFEYEVLINPISIKMVYVALIQSIEYDNRYCTIDWFKLSVKDWDLVRKFF